MLAYIASQDGPSRVFLVFAVSSASARALRVLRPATTSPLRWGSTRGRETIRAGRRASVTGSNRSIGEQLSRPGLWRAAQLGLRPLRSSTIVRSPISFRKRAAKYRRARPFTALFAATLVGLPLGVITGSRKGRGPFRGRFGAVSLILLSMPPLLNILVSRVSSQRAYRVVFRSEV